MTYWLLYAAKHVVLLLLLLATALVVLRYPAMVDDSASHMAAWAWVPAWSLPVAQVGLPFLLAFGWFAYFVAASRIGRPS
jgi:hypothetical protein